MRKIPLLGLLFISVFLTACAQQQQAPSTGAFLGGTQGVLADFEPFGVEEEGKFTIFDTETFPLEVTLRNKGEYDLQLEDVKVKLLGPSPDEFSGIPSFEKQNAAVIDKISELVPLGGEETLSFASDAKYEQDVTGAIDREWFASLEYKYQTYLILPEVCLKEDITDERVCAVNEAKTFFVSGAPVTITGVEESTAGKGIMALRIKVKNVGGGEVAQLGEAFGIRDELSYSIDEPAWECKSGGKVNEARLDNGEAEIVCKLKEALADGTLSTKQVSLTLDYRYRDLIQETLRIKQSVE
ncbi:hypothetical protein HYS49_00335 [Candidatus Woesearchaeota archaeon]|nr:hypothetical protein [Candidatus Woesearchaeota archaeon]